MKYAHSVNGREYRTLDNEYPNIAAYKAAIREAYGSLRGVKVWECQDKGGAQWLNGGV